MSAATRIAFGVVSGGGRIAGTHSGSPYAEPPDVTAGTVAAHRGLARAYVRSNEVRVGGAAARRRLAAVHVEAGRRGAARIFVGEGHGAPPPPIVVRATAPGLISATLSIPLTTDPAALPEAVASASVGQA